MFRSYRSKLQTSFLILGLLAVAASYWPASVGSTRALQQTTYDRLTTIRETKRRAIEDYFTDLISSIQALSTDESTVAALERFQLAWPSLPRLSPGGPGYDALVAHYERTFGALGVPPQGTTAELVRRWFPTDPQVLALQHQYISGNRFPVGAKDLLVRPEGNEGGQYAEVHAQYHPTFHKYQSALGFYDIFLIDAREGRILYTVFKEVDVGMRLTDRPYDSTTLANVFHRALALESPDETVIEDYAPYVASYFAPAAFVATPIRRAGSTIGVLVVQVSIERVNRVMTGDQSWVREGLGRTGQAYVVGSDRTLRSDLRFEIEQPDAFFAQIERAGASHDAVTRIRRDGTAILNLSVQDPRIFETGEGTEIGTDVRGVEVIRSHASLQLPGLRWVLVAEMETSEAFAPVAALRRQLLASGITIGIAFIVVAWVLARSVTRPVTALARGTRQLSAQDFGVRLPVESADEIGQLAESFNAMAERLQRTTVSRDELDQANQELNGKKRELELLNARLMSAQEEERRRLARELHDDLTQRLAAVAIEAGRLKQLPEDGAQSWRDGIRRIQEQLAQIANDVHGLSRRLHSATLEDLGLIAAIEGECRGFFERGGAPVEFTHVGAADRIGDDTALVLYRIVQEGLRNVWRHAHATEVAIRLRCGEAQVELQIADNGRGFDRADPQWRPGIGLASMGERARLAGGTCDIHSSPGNGTSITITIPLKGTPDAPTAPRTR